jgi:hypothetical protein
MWDGFKDHPMRRDYVEPDDFEYEPTAHDEVLARAQAHKDREQGVGKGNRTWMAVADNKTEKPEGWNRPPVIEPDGEGELLEVAMGPHHPSTHGVFRMDVALDGERVIRLKPVFGYLHRNHEKIAEGMSYLGSMPYTDRLDYICPLTNNWAYALAVEKLTGQEVPERAEYLRVILGELTRFQNHASSIGFLIQEMGASGTPLMYAFREREKILDLFEELTGARMMVNYMRFGGCRVDASPAWLDKTARKVVAGLPGFVDELDRLLSTNEILMARTQGVGMLRPSWRSMPEYGADAARLGRELRHSQGGRLRHLQPLQLPRAAGRSWDVYDRYHDSPAGDAGVDQDSGAGAQRYSRRAGDGPQGEDSRLPAQAGRGLRAHRSAQGRAGLLSHQRRRAESLSLPDSPAEPDQPDGAEDMCLGKRGRRGADLWQCGYCAGRSGSGRRAVSYRRVSVFLRRRQLIS